jgi:hypothetical protein
MRRISGLITVLFLSACAGQDAAADPCELRVDVIAPQPVRVGGTRVVEVDVIERSGNCSNIDKEIAWRSSASDVVEITASNQTSATILARRMASSTISAWLVKLPAVRDSVTISVGPLVDN